MKPETRRSLWILSLIFLLLIAAAYEYVVMYRWEVR